MVHSLRWPAIIVIMLTLLNMEGAVLCATALPYSSTNVEVMKSQEIQLNQFRQQLPPTQPSQQYYQTQRKTVPQVQYNRQPAGVVQQQQQQFQYNRQPVSASTPSVQYKRQSTAVQSSGVQSNYRPIAAAAVAPASSQINNVLIKRTQPLTVAATTTHRIPTVQEIKASERAVVKASNDFARDLYEQVRSEPGNFVISPLSISGMLALTWLGAAGRTAQQISSALHLPRNADQVIDGYRHLYQTLQAASSPAMQLATGSKVLVRRGLALKEDFRRLAKDVFAAEADELDFSRPNDAAALINNWVKQRTNDKIYPFIQPEALSPETSLLLANAVYFKAKWETPFDPEQTTSRPFRSGRSADAPAQNVTLMYTQGDFPFANLEELQAKAVRMPYVGQRASMVVVLPDAVDGLEKLEAALGSKQWPLERVLNAMKVDDVHVWLPRFTAQSSLTLNGPLTKLGLGELFGPSADFSGIANAGSFLSQVMQKAFIEVNEEGTEAAAASGGIFFLSAGLYNFFRADHPFLFYIIDDQTNTILFQGHFTTPEEF